MAKLLLVDEHFDDGVRAQYFAPSQEYAEKAATEQAKISLAAIEDPTSVLDLRDWMCSQWSKCSSCTQPLTKADIRMFMDGLRALGAEHRAAWALQKIASLLASSLLHDAEVIQAYACSAAEELPRAPALPLRKAAEELSKTFKLRPMSMGQLQNLARELGITAPETVRLVLDVVRDPEAWYKRYANADVEQNLEAPTEFWGGICLPKELFFSKGSGSVVGGSSSNTSNMPPWYELHLIMDDGTIMGMSGKGAAVPAACAKLGARVVAACSVPMSTFVVAILTHENSQESRQRKIVLWDALDNQSFAVLHESLETWDALDVQLNGEGDMLVQVCKRGAEGRAAAAPRTLCLRMRGRDVSTVHHAPMDVVRSERILAQRLENGKVNHMDHGNVVSWKVQCAGKGNAGLTEVWYGGVFMGSLPQEAVACWGNPSRVYAWTKSREVWVGVPSAADSEPLHTMTFQMEPGMALQGKWDPTKRVVGAIHVTEA